MSVIEKKTAENAARITRQTGKRPGVAPQRQQSRSNSSAAVAPDPGTVGAWSDVIDTDVVPIFQAVLPDGQVLMWDSVGDGAPGAYTDYSFTRAMVWNPTNNSFKRVDVQGADIFCAGFAHLPNGDILVAGGNKDSQLDGIIQTHIFHWRTETWTRGKDMAAARWYPAVTQMANGSDVIIGGGPAIPEVYQTNGLIRQLTGFNNPTYGARMYPFMASRPDAQLGLLGPYQTVYTLTTAGNGAITWTGTRDAMKRDYGSFAPYDIGKTLVTGGGSVSEDGLTKVPTRTSVIVHTSANGSPTVTTTSSLAIRRRQFNTTILADGTVLATGGETTTAGSGLVDLNNAATSAELWNPATGQWTTLSSASRIRQYHSTAALLPDGRVLTGGGGVCAPCVNLGYLEKNVEYFSPPYLFASDGSGAPAVRPVIGAAPTSIAVNTEFSLTSAQAGTIKKVALVGLGDVTHDVNQGQRYVPLRFSVAGTTLTVTGPPNGGVTPPGYYMLFIIDNSGVPSVAKILQVAKGPRPIMGQVRNRSTGLCIDVPAAGLASDTYLQTLACDKSKGQALTRLPNDNSLRVLGMCVDVPYRHFVSGHRIWDYSCNGTNAQEWSFPADGTIRPLAKSSLCLAPSAAGSSLVIATCNGSTVQKWTY